MKKNYKKIIWLSIIILLFLFLIFIFTKDIYQNTKDISPPSPIPIYSENENKAFLEISGKRIETNITENENIYDLMAKLQKEGKIKFKDKNYTGMGKFIEEINGIKPSEGKYWIYYVNGKKANIGISNYKIKTGDVVSWKLENNI